MSQSPSSTEPTTADEPDRTASTSTADPKHVILQVEAALLTTDRPLSTSNLSEVLGELGPNAVQEAVNELNRVYAETGRSFRIERVAGGWQIVTLPDFGDVLTALHKTRQQTKLGPAALETLAIIAYKQPTLRSEIESIRGVACGEMIRNLMERHLVKIVGRAEELGRPMLYGTTKTFLEVFGLGGLKDLPNLEELKPQI